MNNTTHGHKAIKNEQTGMKNPTGKLLFAYNTISVLEDNLHRILTAAKCQTVEEVISKIELLTAQGLDDTISDEEIDSFVEKELSFIHGAVRNQDFDLGFRTGVVSFIAGANFARKQQPAQVPLNELKDFLFNIHEVEDNRLYFTLPNVQQFISRYESGQVPPDLLVHDWTTQPVDNWVKGEDVRNKLGPVANLIAIIRNRKLFSNDGNKIDELALREISNIEQYLNEIKQPLPTPKQKL